MKRARNFVDLVGRFEGYGTERPEFGERLRELVRHSLEDGFKWPTTAEGWNLPGRGAGADMAAARLGDAAARDL